MGGSDSLGKGPSDGAPVVAVGSGMIGETDGTADDDGASPLGVGLTTGDELVGAGAGGRARLVVGPGRGCRTVWPDVGSGALCVLVGDTTGAEVAAGDCSTLGDSNGEGDSVGEGDGVGSAEGDGDGDGDEPEVLRDGVGRTGGVVAGSASTGRAEPRAMALSTTARTPAATTPTAPQRRVLGSRGSCMVPRLGSVRSCGGFRATVAEGEWSPPSPR